MKKYTILLMLCLAFSYVKAQTILVNSNVISVHEDVTFPLWLDSMSTIEIGTQVVSISALEFNIVAATNGNSLVFSQTKTITSQETVPNGMTWKITAVLLDSTAINNSSSSGGGQVIVSGSGGNMAVALSQESANTMSLEHAMIYCDSLQEGGYDNWVIPTLEEMVFVAGGGGVVPSGTNSNWLWTSTAMHEGNNSSGWIQFNLEGNWTQSYFQNNLYVRCVRHESISVSGSGSSSGGSNSTSGGGGGNVAVALSNESASTMTFQNAILYCDNLNESGYTDWVMPTLNEMTFISSGGCVIPDTRTEEYIWTRSMITAGSSYEHVYKIRLQNTSGPNSGQDVITGSRTYNFMLNKARCVRHGSISVSNSGSSSGGSNTPSTLGSGMPTMLSNESATTMQWGEAVLYCDSLNEAGYSDWIMPNLDQLTYAISGGSIITDSRTEEMCWTRTIIQNSSSTNIQLISLLYNQNHTSSIYQSNTYMTNNYKCRCVR